MIHPCFLAQIDKVDPAFLSNSILMLFGIVGLIVGALTIWNAVRLRPPHETPTRREFDALREQVQHIAADLRPMERRILDAVEKSTGKLSDEIQKVAESDHKGRVDIWEKLHGENKSIGERIARLEARQKP
ncbi:MAG TPA: hypothetical protein PLA50_05215 [Bacteroidia bacterium]|nr:hypothetical protein [Bacteroidia bacterium]